MWHPIETAPKDGTSFIAALRYRDENEPSEVLTIQWHEPWGEWVLAGCLIGIQNNAKDDENMEPVAWMASPSASPAAR